jgi:hypothetical protein
MIKNITIIVLTLLLAASIYYIGYMAGARHEVLRSTAQNDARFRIAVFDALYHSAERGDLQKIQSTMRMVLLGEVREYQYGYGDETGTNSFAKHYLDAKAIADMEESQLVPISSILTNFPHTPDAKVTVGGDK